MDYVLKNKDREVLSFSSKEQNGMTMLYDINILNKDLLPFKIQAENINEGLVSWIKRRKIPEDRQFAKNILLTIDKFNSKLLGYIDASFGLSLNDAYWIIPADKNYKWDDYNLYHHEFDNTVQLAAFGQKAAHEGGFSPEFTTNGMLKKCWYRENDRQIYLYKGSYQMEASAEYYNYQIAELLGFNAISYGIINFHKYTVSRCPLFTDENNGFIPIEDFFKKDITSNSFLEKYCAEIYGQKAFEDMMFFDALIGNIDRHTGNFGMIIDNNTNKILKAAPIFDNGMGMLGAYVKNKTIRENFEISVSAFNKDFDEQLTAYVRPRHMEKLEKLLDFKFVRHELSEIEDTVLCEFEELLHERVQKILSSSFL